MAEIKLKTDGKRYNQLIEKREKQLAALAELEAYEKRASKACAQAICEYTDADDMDDDDTEDEDQQPVERIIDWHVAEADAKYKQATKRCFELVDATAKTFIEVVAELIHDNIDVLDGMNINGKQVFLALNEALPEDIFVDTNMKERDTVLRVNGGERNKRVHIALQRINIITHIQCCGKNSHFIDKKRFLADYAMGKYVNTVR